MDIVVPIYNAREDVRRCIESIRRWATGDWRLVLVDDASPDEALAEDLRRIAQEEPRVVLLRNEKNGGFVVTANRGMREAKGRDVCLLNSDTIVTERFLEKLADCAYADDTTGIVSPLTNNGTICSIPEFCRDNALPEGLGVDAFARLVDEVSLHQRPEIVTAVGFCMYIRADVFEKVGYFDADRFGRGYGEENDFCERAKGAGYRVRLCDDLFIYHSGQASFVDETNELLAKNLKTLGELHPSYHSDVRKFIERNPLCDIQENIKLSLRRGGREASPAILFVLHTSPFAQYVGGTEFYVRDKISALKYPRALVVYPEADALVVAEVLDGRIDEPIFYRFPTVRLPERWQIENDEASRTMETIVRVFGVTYTHIEHLQFWPIRLWELFAKERIPYAFTVHDYYSVCPNMHLVHPETAAPCRCGASSADHAETCLADFAKFAGVSPPAEPARFLLQWRQIFHDLLTQAHAIVYPSDAAKAIVNRYHTLPEANQRVIPHGYDAMKCRVGTPPRGPRLRVAVIGAVAYPPKGSRETLQLMTALKDAPVEWHIFGPVKPWGFIKKLKRLHLGRKLVIHGAYSRQTIQARLRETGIDVATLLSIWPESFCYVLSEAWCADVPVVAFPSGAVGDRIRESGGGLVVEDVSRAAEVLRRLATNPAELDALRAEAKALRHRTISENGEDYDRLYRERLDFDVPPARLDADARCTLVEASRRAGHYAPVKILSEGEVPLKDRLRRGVAYAIKRFMPAEWRFRLLRRLRGQPIRWAYRFPFTPSSGVWQASEKLADAGRSSRQIADGPDAYYRLQTTSISTLETRTVRLVMQCWTGSPVNARLFWGFDEADAPDARRSLLIPLAADGLWNEYVVNLDQTGDRMAWTERPEIRWLRLVPATSRCEFRIRELSIGT